MTSSCERPLFAPLLFLILRASCRDCFYGEALGGDAKQSLSNTLKKVTAFRIADFLRRATIFQRGHRRARHWVT